MGMRDFGLFEDAAFYGKFTTNVIHLFLRELFGDTFKREHETPEGYRSDFYFENLGFVEVTMRSKFDLKARKKYASMSKHSKVWVVVPKMLRQLVSLREQIQSDQEYQYSRTNGARPEDTHLLDFNDLVDQFVFKLGLDNEKASWVKRAIKEPNEVANMTRVFAEEWVKRWATAPSMSGIAQAQHD